MVRSNWLSRRSHQHDAIALAFCTTVLIIALCIGYFHKVGAFGVESDFYQSYAVQAENIRAGRPYTYQLNPPGYCLLLAAVTFLTSDAFVAGKVISAFATALFGWISYLLLKALFNSQIALISTILSLLTLIPNSFLAATDVVGALVIVLPLWIFLGQPFLTFNLCFLAGIFAGIAYLVRFNAIFISIGIIFSIIFIFNQELLQRRLIKAGVFGCGVFLITLPWLTYNWQINGSPFTNTAYLQIAAHFYHPQGDTFITSSMEMSSQFTSLSEVLLHDPPDLLERYLNDVLFLNIPKLFIPQFLLKTLQFPAYQVVMGVPLLFVSIGLLLVVWDARKDNFKSRIVKARLTLLLVCFLGYLVLGLVGFYRRYYLFLFPNIFLLIIYPFFRKRIFTKLWYVRFFRMAVSWLLVVVIAFCLSGAAYLETKSIITSEPRYLLEIADFLKGYSLPNEVIITRKPHLAYLSGLKEAFPLAKSAEEYLLKARAIKARYIAYSDYESSLWSGLKSLSDPKALPNSFKLIYYHEPTNTLIYEITLSDLELPVLHPQR